MSPRPLCHLIPLNVHEEAYPFIKKASLQENDGNVSEYIRALIYKDMLVRGVITKQDLLEWML